MYRTGSPITFTITRNIDATPDTISSVELVDPTGDITAMSITTNTAPTGSTTGTLVWSHTPTEVGLHTYRILANTNTLLVKTINISVLATNLTYTTTI